MFPVYFDPFLKKLRACFRKASFKSRFFIVAVIHYISLPIFFMFFNPLEVLSATISPELPSTDLLILQNGDSLRGSFVKAGKTTISFKSQDIGVLTVGWTKVKYLHVSEHFAVLLKGVRIRQGHVPERIPEGSFDFSNGKISVRSSSGVIQIPLENVVGLVDEKTFDLMILKSPHLWQNWSGSIGAGASLVESTQSLETFNAAISFLRTVPAVSWLEPDNRTVLGFTSTYGNISQPGVPSVQTSIYHGDAEQDEYFSRDFYALAQAIYDHNSTTGLNLQQLYGAGFGYTAIRNSIQELNLSLAASYTDQQFQAQTANQNLIGMTFSVIYSYKFPYNILFNENSYVTPQFNNSRAWLAYLSGGLTIPVIDSFSLSLQAIDNYWNSPAPGFVDNSFQMNLNLTWTLSPS